MNVILSLLSLVALVVIFFVVIGVMSTTIIKAGQKSDEFAKNFRSKKKNRDFVKNVFGVDVKSLEEEDAERFERNVEYELEARRIQREADKREKNR